jgi:subtilisin family serine protease
MSSHRRIVTTLALVVFCLVCFTGAALAVESPTSDSQPAPAQSPYLIVELQAPPLAAVYKTQLQAATANGKLDVNSPSAQEYVNQLQAQQAAFVSQMQTVLPNATVGQYYANEQLTEVKSLSYQYVFNGMAVNPGNGDLDAAARVLANLPGVKAVYPDTPHYTDLYTSTQLINAPVVWDVLGGRENAGAGVKFASMDGGVHKDSPMFDGTGYDYPAGFGPNGLGLTNNNNGKIIASRAYFRSWDPPQVDNPGTNGCGDACAWPGPEGTSHGVHTASTAAGNVVTDVVYSGYTVGTISGVAPRAWVMSYKVFYGSVNGDGSFYNAEGIAALEDIAKDGPDVLNNSWGGGPTSNGNLGDPLETALANTAASGVFISMSAGNAGPANSTSDHPLPDYINVAASTTGGTLASGKVSIPGRDDLQDIAFTTASFGEPLPLATVITYTVLPSIAVDPANVEGCSPWPAGTFTGKAALIRRGTCEFGVKVLLAEQAGAEFVIVYNHAAGGEGLISMGPGEVGDQVTISSIFIGNTAGEAIVADYNSDPASAALVVNTIAFQAGNTPDLITNFSSRGPGVGQVLNPDIAAPGDNILAQGYAPGATGEEQYFGYGQASGTSMAAPHVAGAAVLVREAYPNWSNAAIKSALMTTAKYTDIYNFDGSPAQPLDMGAGRLDLTNVLHPGVILDPPSLSYGAVPTGTAKTLVVTVTSVATETETYALSTLYTGNGFTATTALAGFSVEPASVTLAAGASAQISVTIATTDSMGIGENQGYIVMDGAMYDAHMPAWARVIPAAPLADVLIIDNDASAVGLPDYVDIYTSTLEALGRTYAVVNTTDGFGENTSIPEPAQLAGYDAVLWFTGDNFYSAVTVSGVAGTLGLTEQDRFSLLDYLNNGGNLIAMGQDLASTVDAAPDSSTVYLYNWGLNADWVQDSISNGETPTGYATTAPGVRPVFPNVVLRLTQPYVDEVRPVVDDYGRGSVSVLQYQGPFNQLNGTVAVAHRDQPTLELPDLTYLGRAFYATFGLEGMDVVTVTDELTTTSPVELLSAVFDWTESEPGTATITDVTPVTTTAMTLFSAEYITTTATPADAEAIAWRWDFGDGSSYVSSNTADAGHTYLCSDDNVYTVRVEITDSAGNSVVASQQVDVSNSCSEEERGFFLPFAPNNSSPTR